MKILELFSGNKNFKGALTLDSNPKTNPDICIDIMKWNYKKYGPFDFIWASPPCTEYSKAKTRGIRDIEGANKIVEKTLEIIDYFKPKFWIIENPQTGLLKQQEFMQGIPYTDVDYCMYGKLCRKRTRLWNNFNMFGLLCDKKCQGWNGHRHKKSCGNGRDNMYTSYYEKCSIPKTLIDSIYDNITKQAKMPSSSQ